MALPDYSWDQDLGRYRNAATGRLVGTAEIRAALDRAIRLEGQRARALANSLRMGEVTVREWEIGMREVVKNTQLFSAAAARGGWAQMDAQAYGHVGQKVREQYAYLDQFAAEVRSGLGRDGMFLRRSESYAEAARPVYHEIERDVREAAGATVERSVRSPGDSCVECIVEEAKDWQPIGTMVPVGQRQCRNGCNCQVEYA